MARPLGIGFIGSSWMARVHAHALHSLGHMVPEIGPIRLVAIAGRDSGATRSAATALGFVRSTTDWRQVVDDPEIDIVANLASNDVHLEPTIAALDNGKHVLCEKPLASSVSEAQQMADAAARSEALAVCGYNYRFVPALRLIHRLITSGQIGVLRHCRLSYSQDYAGTESARTGWRFEDPMHGSAVGDYSHIIDLMRWLVGEPVQVCGTVSTLAPDAKGMRESRIGTDSEDKYSALVRTASGVTATLEASRVATGSRNSLYLEIVGSAGSVRWDMERLNQLQVYKTADEVSSIAGYRDVMVTEADHPFIDHWWPAGHVLGWEHTFANEWLHMLQGVRRPERRDSELPLFTDGLQATRVVTAIRQSAHDNAWVKVAT